jgi:hypothetical protein
MEPISAAVVGLAAKYLPDIVSLFTDNKKAGKTASVVAEVAKQVTGSTTLQGIDSALQERPELVLELRKAIMADAHIAEQMRLSDIANARDMQREALKQEDKFSKRFIYYYAIVWTVFAFVYVFSITFFGIPPESIRFADTILGFLLGTGMSAIMQFFFGSSHGSKAKDEIVSSITKK